MCQEAAGKIVLIWPADSSGNAGDWLTPHRGMHVSETPNENLMPIRADRR